MIRDKKITKKDLFAGPFNGKLCVALNRDLSSLKRTFKIPKVSVLFNAGDSCHTDGWNITLGMGFSLFHDSSLTVPQIVSCMHGATFHEIGHILYSPMSVLTVANEAAYKGNFWPHNPDNWTQDIGDYISQNEKTAARSFTFYHNLSNIIEDGRIEYLLFTNLGRYNGYKVGLKLLRSIQETRLEDLSEMLKNIDNEKDSEALIRLKYEFVFEVMLQLAIFGTLKGVSKEVYSHRLMKRVLRNSSYVSDALDSIEAEETYDNINHIYCDLFEEFLKPYFELCEDDENEEFEVVPGTPGAGGSQGQSQNGPSQSSAAGKSLVRILKRVGVLAPPQAGDTNVAKEIAVATEGAKNAASQSKLGSSAVNDTKDTDNQNGVNNSNDVEIGRFESTSVWGGASSDTTFTKEDKQTSKAVDLDAITNLKTEAEMQQEASQKLDDTLQSPKGGSFGSANDGVSWHINRFPDSTNVDKINYEAGNEILKIGRETAKKVKRFLVDNTQSVSVNSYSGKKFKPGRVYRPVPKYFEKSRNENESPNCSIYVVGDQSGSMGGDRIKAVKATFMVLCEMAQNIKQLRFGAFGHHASGYSVYIDNYILPDEDISKAKYKVMKVYTSGCNRDGAALRYVAELLKKEDTDKKLLIMISDGQPNAGGYGGTAAEEDIRNAITEYERFGIHIVAAAIGEDKERIKYIYGNERFMDITNLSQLPDTFCQVVSRVLKA